MTHIYVCIYILITLFIIYNIVQHEHSILYNTPIKAWENVYVAGYGPYMWSGYEQRKGNVGYKFLFLARDKGVTVLGRK